MLRNRIIPCLLLHNEKLVKTVKFKNPVYVGDPINAIRIFNEKEVDEIVLLDISASKTNSGPNFKLIENIAGECFMPLCYGGGITNMEHVDKLFSIGVEKVCIQTEAIRKISFINDVANKYGSQAITVSVDIKRNIWGSNKIFSYLIGKSLNINWLEGISSFIEAGAGEIMLNSIDRDGTMKGMDLESIEMVSKSINVPLIAIGGVGSLEDINEGLKSGANAISAGSFFVFHGPHKAVLITYPSFEH
jgi:cyclase